MTAHIRCSCGFSAMPGVHATRRIVRSSALWSVVMPPSSTGPEPRASSAAGSATSSSSTSRTASARRVLAERGPAPGDDVVDRRRSRPRHATSRSGAERAVSHRVPPGAVTGRGHRRPKPVRSRTASRGAWRPATLRSVRHGPARRAGRGDRRQRRPSSAAVRPTVTATPTTAGRARARRCERDLAGRADWTSERLANRGRLRYLGTAAPIPRCSRCGGAPAR